MSDVGWVAHVLLLFNLIGLIGPLAIPPNDQLRGLARARLSFSESSWASRDAGMSNNISVFASFSRQIHTIGRGGGGRGDGDVVKQGPHAFCICSHPSVCLSPVLHVMPDMVHARQRGDKETKGDRDSPCRSPQLGPRDVSLPFPLIPSRRMVGSLPPLTFALLHFGSVGRSDGCLPVSSPAPSSCLCLSISISTFPLSLRLTLVASGGDKSHGICRGDQ